jgi:hypothetical protein
VFPPFPAENSPGAAVQQTQVLTEHLRLHSSLWLWRFDRFSHANHAWASSPVVDSVLGFLSAFVAPDGRADDVLRIVFAHGFTAFASSTQLEHTVWASSTHQYPPSQARSSVHPQKRQVP